jgi:hypothetical protein
MTTMTTTTARATTMTTSVQCRECDAEIPPSTRRAYSELFGSNAMLRLADEMADVLERDPAARADDVVLRSIESWLGHDADALVAAVRHRLTEGYS